MASKLSALKILDRFLFQQIDEFKKNPQYQKVVTDLGNLGELEYKYITYISSFFVIFSPMIIVFIMYNSNINYKEEIKTKDLIYTNINSYIQKSNAIKVIGRAFISPSSFENKNQFNSKLEQILTQNDIKSGSFLVKEFNILNGKFNIVHSQAVITFKDMALENLSRVMIDLMQNLKVKVESFTTNIDNKNKLLSGEISVLHYGRSENQE